MGKLLAYALAEIALWGIILWCVVEFGAAFAQIAR